ncbi:hypothetical protein DSECCO2_660180 [anaerobic digester metagenome]
MSDLYMYALSGTLFLKASTTSSKPDFVLALKSSTTASVCLAISSIVSLLKASTSDLLCTIMKGVSLFLNSLISAISCDPNLFPAISKTAQSTVLIDWSDFRMRFSPRSPVSSIPAVSTIMTGPIPKISTDFFTGSVVVPACSETIATSCPVITLMKELLPLLRRPKMPMCGLRSLPLLIASCFDD